MDNVTHGGPEAVLLERPLAGLSLAVRMEPLMLLLPF